MTQAIGRAFSQLFVRPSCSRRSIGANAASPVSGWAWPRRHAAAAVLRGPVADAAVRAAVGVVSDMGAASALPFSSAPFATAQRYLARSLFASFV
jgi:hypothetical protein